MGRPDSAGLDAQLALADLRARMFGRPQPIEIDRYRLVRVLGRGAHGTVFEAYDRELLRPVALKVLRYDRAGERAATKARRLLREARAMAQVIHPHVVEVYAAGATDDAVWIAMALVQGGTLAQWNVEYPVADGQRFVRANQLLLEAGRGLAAAHAQGLIHRDFKPANVLVGTDGHVKVADFGLARAWRTGRSTQRRLGQDPNKNTGIAGTPRYMSPEQHRGERVGAASDQFNFAVTAWELLYGVHPFVARASPTHGPQPPDRSGGLADAPSLPDAVRSGSVQRPPSSGVPTHVERALRRALNPNPRRRFDTMAALVQALQPIRSRTRRGVAVAALGTVAAVAIAAMDRDDTPMTDCSLQSGQARTEAVWNEQRRRALATGLADSGATDVTEALVAAVDAYARGWAVHHSEVCQAHRDTRTTAPAFDSSMACLRDNLRTMDGVLSELTDPTPELAARAVTAIAAVPSPMRCDASQSAWEVQTRESLGLRAELAQARTHLVAGRYVQAAMLGESVAGTATAAALSALAGEALEVAGVALAELNDVRHFEVSADAYYRAVALADDGAAARRAITLARQYGYAAKLTETQQWIRHAEAALARRADPKQALALEHVRTILVHRSGHLEQAVASMERLHARAASVLGPHAEVAWLIATGLCSGRLALQDSAGATQLLDVLDEQVRVLGEAHPRHIRLAKLRARMALSQGDADAALQHALDAAARAEQAFGAVNPRTSEALVMLAWAHHLGGDLVGAEASYRRALTASGDMPERLTIRLLTGLASLQASGEAWAESAKTLERAVEVVELLLPEASEQGSRTRLALAEVWIDMGRLQSAQQQLTLALADPERGFRPKHAVRAWVDLAVVHERLGQPRASARAWRHAAGLCTVVQSPAPWCALAQVGERVLVRHEPLDRVADRVEPPGSERSTAATLDAMRAWARFKAQSAGGDGDGASAAARQAAERSLRSLSAERFEQRLLAEQLRRALAQSPASG